MGLKSRKGIGGRPRVNETKLSRWIDANSNREQFAEAIGVERNYLDMLCRGARQPSLRLALKIEHLTAGEVSAHDVSNPT